MQVTGPPLHAWTRGNFLPSCSRLVVLLLATLAFLKSIVCCMTRGTALRALILCTADLITIYTVGFWDIHLDLSVKSARRMASHMQLHMLWQGCLAGTCASRCWPRQAGKEQDERLCMTVFNCAGMNASPGLTHRPMHRSLPASMGRMKFMPPAPRPPTSGPPSRAPDHRPGCEISHHG